MTYSPAWDIDTHDGDAQHTRDTERAARHDGFVEPTYAEQEEDAIWGRLTR